MLERAKNNKKMNSNKLNNLQVSEDQQIVVFDTALEAIADFYSEKYNTTMDETEQFNQHQLVYNCHAGYDYYIDQKDMSSAVAVIEKGMKELYCSNEIEMFYRNVQYDDIKVVDQVALKPCDIDAPNQIFTDNGLAFNWMNAKAEMDKFTSPSLKYGSAEKNTYLAFDTYDNDKSVWETKFAKLTNDTLIALEIVESDIA